MKLAFFIIAFVICAAGSLAIKMENLKIKWYWHNNKLIGLFYITAAIMFLILFVKELRTRWRKKSKSSNK